MNDNRPPQESPSPEISAAEPQGGWPTSDHTFDGGALDCGSGLILLIRQHLLNVPPGGVLEILSSEPTVETELPPWCLLTGNHHLQSAASEPGRWRHYVRRGVAAETKGKLAAEAASLADDWQQAREFTWRLRGRLAPEVTVYARNQAWKTGLAVDFERQSTHPSALEYLVGGLIADLLSGWNIVASQHRLVLDELEIMANVRLANTLAALGAEPGDPAISEINLAIYLTTPASASETAAVWQRVQERSIAWQTLIKACRLEARLISL